MHEQNPCPFALSVCDPAAVLALRMLYTPLLLATIAAGAALSGCGPQTPAQEPTAQSPVTTAKLEPSASAAPKAGPSATPSATPAASDPNTPIRIDRASKPAPWFEGRSAPFTLWEQGPSSGGITRMINPILGETRAIAIEPGAIVLDTRVGQLIRTRDGGVRGVAPKGLRFIGVLAGGEVIAENSYHAPLLAATVDDFIAAKGKPIDGIDRALDATGKYIVAISGEKLVRSSDSGKTFVEINVKGPITRAFVRPDGVTLAGAAGAPDGDHWFLIDANGKAEPLKREIKSPMRWGAYIMDDLQPTDTDEAGFADILTNDGRTFARIFLPPEAQGAEYISFHPLYLGAPTEKTRAWNGDAMAIPPKKPAPKKKRIEGPLAFAAVDSAEIPAGGVVGGVMSGVVGGVLGGPSGEPREPPCKGLLCIAKNRPIIPERPGSNLVGRFFDDALCKGPVAGKCEDGPLLRPPTIGLFNQKTREISFRKTPPSCDPISLESLRGLVILDCKHDRFAADDAGTFAHEGPVDDAMKGSWYYSVADDGTILAERIGVGGLVGATIRLPVPPGTAGAWRTITKPGAVGYFVVPGGAAVVAASNATGDRLTLSLDAPEGASELAAAVPIERPVRQIVLRSGYPEIVFADSIDPPSARVSRRGALVTPLRYDSEEKPSD